MRAVGAPARAARRARPLLRALRRTCLRSRAAALVALAAAAIAALSAAVALLALPALRTPAAHRRRQGSTAASVVAYSAADAGEGAAPRRPRIYVAPWGETQRAALQRCVADRLPEDARTTSLGTFDLPSLRALGVNSSVFAESDMLGLDSLLLHKFGEYSERTDTMSEADFFYISSPLSLVVDCMRASNEEQRRVGVPRGDRVYPKIAMHYANFLFADLVNSEEYALAVRKKYPSLILAQTEYTRELEILADGSPFWSNLARFVLRITPELPQRCAGGYFLQAPYPAHVAPKNDDISALQRATFDERRKRGKVVYYAGSCTKTRSHAALCSGLRAADDADAATEPRRSPLESVTEQPSDHFARVADAAFCAQPGARARTRRDFYDAALLGCIPALFKGDADAYSRVLAPAHTLADFAVVVDTDSGGADETAPEKLRQVPAEQLRSLRGALADAMPRLRYAKRRDETSDAFAGILDNLALVMRKPEMFACAADTKNETE